MIDKKKLEDSSLVMAMPILMEKVFDHMSNEGMDIPNKIKKVHLQSTKGLINEDILDNDKNIDFDKLREVYSKKVIDKLFYEINDPIKSISDKLSRTLRDQLVETIDNLHDSTASYYDITIQIGKLMMDEFKKSR